MLPTSNYFVNSGHVKRCSGNGHVTVFGHFRQCEKQQPKAKAWLDRNATLDQFRSKSFAHDRIGLLRPAFSKAIGEYNPKSGNPSVNCLPTASRETLYFVRSIGMRGKAIGESIEKLGWKGYSRGRTHRNWSSFFVVRRLGQQRQKYSQECRLLFGRSIKIR